MTFVTQGLAQSINEPKFNNQLLAQNIVVSPLSHRQTNNLQKLSQFWQRPLQKFDLAFFMSTLGKLLVLQLYLFLTKETHRAYGELQKCQATFIMNTEFVSIENLRP